MIAPPRIATSLLEGLGADQEFRDAVIGDLAEEFAIRLEYDGVDAARRWYYREVIRTAPHLLRNWAWRLRPREVARVAGVVLASYVTVAMIGALIAKIVMSVTAAFDVALTLQRLPLTNPIMLAAALFLGLLPSTFGGYVAARFDAKSPLISALALGMMWASAAAIAGAIDTAFPMWYKLAVLFVLTIGTTVGGILRVRGTPA